MRILSFLVIGVVALAPAGGTTDCGDLGISEESVGAECRGDDCVLYFSVGGLPPNVTALAFLQPIVPGEDAWDVDPTTGSSGVASFAGPNGGNGSGTGNFTIIWGGPPYGDCSNLSVDSPGCNPGC